MLPGPLPASGCRGRGEAAALVRGRPGRSLTARASSPLRILEGVSSLAIAPPPSTDPFVVPPSASDPGSSTTGAGADRLPLEFAVLPGLRPTGLDKWKARCPAHDDRTPSLNIAIDGDRVLIHCFAGCSRKEVVEALGRTEALLFLGDARVQVSPRTLARYVYCDALGVPRYAVARLERRGNKYRYEHPAADGTWLPGRGEHPPMLYRLPDLLTLGPDSGIWCTEGEKDADTLRSIGIPATTAPSGSWGKVDLSPLRGLHGVVICDADAPGIRKGRTRSEHLRGAGVRLPDSAILHPAVEGLKDPDLTEAFEWVASTYGRDHQDFEVLFLNTLRPITEWAPGRVFADRLDGRYGRVPSGLERAGSLEVTVYACLSMLSAGSGLARASSPELAEHLGVGRNRVQNAIQHLIDLGYIQRDRRTWYRLPLEA